jgi:hypothetical protein
MSTEQEQRRTVPRSERLGVATERPPATHRPSRFTTLLLLGVAAGVLLAVVAGVTAGWSYAIPVLGVVAAILVLVAIQRTLAVASTHRRNGRVNAAADDNEDPIPHIGLDDDEPLGATPDQGAVEDPR